MQEKKQKDEPHVRVYNSFLKQKLKELTPQEFEVVVLLEMYAGEDRICEPSEETLAEDTGMSVRNIRRILKSLEKKGLCKINKKKRPYGGGFHNYYTGLPDKLTAKQPDKYVPLQPDKMSKKQAVATGQKCPQK
jgi:transcription initiation factor IIE alpha subunit